MACAWPVHGLSMVLVVASAWPVHGLSMACAWPLHGQCMASAWPGGCLRHGLMVDMLDRGEPVGLTFLLNLVGSQPQAAAAAVAEAYQTVAEAGQGCVVNPK